MPFIQSLYGYYQLLIKGCYGTLRVQVYFSILGTAPLTNPYQNNEQDEQDEDQ
jgi:hypothetical protein